MRGKASSLLIVSLVAALACLYGIVIHRHRIFPYRLVQQVHRGLFPRRPAPEGPWSIGIYAGPSPFQLSAPAGVRNPVVTAEDVTDLDAEYVADPFLVATDSSYALFFEVVSHNDARGDIAVARSADGRKWRYERIVLDEPFHLSYPYVFKEGNDHYMVPESHEDLSVRLYRATDFPFAWRYEGTLLRGYHFVDPSVVRYRDRWWMFVSVRESDALNLYYASDLHGPWIQHPLSPVVRNRKDIARPGGRLLVMDGRLYRFAQDDHLSYGSQVFAFEITEIGPTTYRERMVGDGPVVRASGEGWNAAGMHHVDPLQTSGGTWLAAVDGCRRAPDRSARAAMLPTMVRGAVTPRDPAGGDSDPASRAPRP
jgi:hypothetical protein